MAPHPIVCQVPGCVTRVWGTTYKTAGHNTHSAHLDDAKFHWKIVQQVTQSWKCYDRGVEHLNALDSRQEGHPLEGLEYFLIFPEAQFFRA